MAEHARRIEPVAINWSDWIAVDEAARRIGVHRASLCRRCKKELEPRGLAIKVPPARSCTPQWFIKRCYDHRLDVEQVDRPGDLDMFTMQQRRVIHAKIRCVELYRQAKATRPGSISSWVDAFADNLARTEGEKLERYGVSFNVSPRSLRRWDRDYHGPADAHKLADQRGGDQKSKGDPKAWEYFRAIYLDQRKPSKKTCWKRTKQWAAAEGVSWCSYASLLRLIDKRITVEEQIKDRDPKRWRSQFAAYIEQDPERYAAGQCWVGDHRPLDLLCRIGRRIFRPFVTTWQDWRTRKIVGWAITDNPNSSTILAALRMGILEPSNMGGPSVVYIDNGKDFDCYSFHGETKQQRRQRGRVDLKDAADPGLFDLLGIEAHFALTYNPQGKARMERWYATVGDQFDKTFATYTSPDTVRKPEQLKDIVKHLHKVPTFDHVRDRFERFVQGYNVDADHSIDDLVDADGKRLSPVEAMARWCDTRRVMADPASLDLLLMQHHKPVRVGRNGISITIAGERVTYGQFNDALRRFKGTKEEVRVAYDPEDARVIKVFDKQWVFVCYAEINTTGGRYADPVQRDHIAAVNRKKAKYRRSMNFISKHREVEYLSGQEQLADQIARKPESTEARADPQRLKIVRTPVDGQSKHVQHRKAAGAEGQHDPEPMGDPDAWSDVFKSPTPPANDIDDDLLSEW